MSYLSSTRNITVPQSKPLRGQSPNHAGGFTWKISKWDRLSRFLVLGSEGGTYYQRERELTLENISCIEECLAEDAERAVQLAVEISVGGRAPKNDPAIYVVACALAHTDVTTRRLGAGAVNAVCRTGTHIFMLEHFALQLRGHGPVFRRAIAGWYESKSAEQLAYQMVKYRERNFTRGRGKGRRHADLIKTARPKPTGDAHSAVLRWGIEKPVENEVILPEVINAFRLAQEAKTSSEIVKLLVDNPSLPWEALPRDLINGDVWEALLPRMPLTAMIRNLATMTRLGTITPMSTPEGIVRQRLASVDEIRRARVHPIQVLSALMTYSQGRGNRSSQTWTPNQRIVEALDRAFYLAFGNVQATGKNILLALDVSGSMYGNPVAGVPGLDAATGAAAMALVTAAVEPYYQIVGFTTGSGRGAYWESTNRSRYGWAGSGLEQMEFSPRSRLDDVVRYMKSLPMGGTDCALPMLYAEATKLPVDAFCVYTDNETWAGDMHPAKALTRYRTKMNRLGAKLAVVGMTATDCSIADPNDPGMLDFVGFDTAVPNLLSQFIEQ